MAFGIVKRVIENGCFGSPKNVRISINLQCLFTKSIDFSFDPVTVKGELKVKFNKETGIFYYLELKAS